MGELKLEATPERKTTSVKRVVSVVAFAFLITGAVFALTADNTSSGRSMSTRRLQEEEGEEAGEEAEEVAVEDEEQLGLHLRGDDLAILEDCQCNPKKGCSFTGLKSYCEVDTLNCMGFDYQPTMFLLSGIAGQVDGKWDAEAVYGIAPVGTENTACGAGDGTSYTGKCRAACEAISGRYDCWEFPCRNHGVCIDGEDDYVCSCALGFDGGDCQNNINECTLPKDASTWGEKDAKAYPCYVDPNMARGNNAECEDMKGQLDEAWGTTKAKCEEFFPGDTECMEEAAAREEGENAFVLGQGFRCACEKGTAETGGKGLEGNGYRYNLPKLQRKLVGPTGMTADGNLDWDTGETDAGAGGALGPSWGCRDVDDCASTPCANGGTCSDDNWAWRFECDCVGGWMGFQCDVDIDECADPSSNICVKPMEIYAHRNTLGDQKSYLEMREDGTGEKIMLKTATCINKQGGYSCVCDPGWEGDARTGLVGWREEVQVGMALGTEYVGCVDINDCASIPCFHGGTCSEPDNLFGTGEYECECPFGWHGHNCELDDDECEAPEAEMREICSPVATCENTDGSYSCTCNDGWTGDGITCIDADDCEFSPCANGGTCTDLGTLKFNCDCVAGWRGPICSDDWNECTMGIHTCHDSASCVNNEGSFSCRCDPGYSGDGHLTCIDINDCEVYKNIIGGDPNFVCLAGECGAADGIQLSVVIHGTCEDVGPQAFVGTCEVGWTDANCDLDVNECDPIDGEAQCHTHATCVNSDGSYACICDPGFSGDGVAACTDINDCATACSNGGACTDMGANDFKCACQNGWTNRRCDFDINECAAYTHTCHGNANCINAQGSFACKCKDGFSGDGTTDCTDLDDCATGPCDHGVCSDEGAHMYNCACETGWTDTNCDFDVNECYLNKHNCHVDARCVNAPGSFYCRCLSGYEGDGYVTSHIHNDYTARDMYMERKGSEEEGYTFNIGRDILDEQREHVGAEEVIGMNAKGCIDLDDCSPRWGPEGQCNPEHGTCFDHGQNNFVCYCNDAPNPHWCGRYCEADCEECTLGTHTCDPHATCTNTYGSFTCECNEEFYGDGAVCAECTKCPVGYKMIGEGCGAPNKFIDRTCVDVNECLDPALNNCNREATCENTQGSFTCTCGPEGIWWGDGVECTTCTMCNVGNEVDNEGFEVANVITDGYHEASPCTVTADRICSLNVPDGVYMMESEAEGGSTAAGDKECLAFLSADAANFDGSFTFPERFNWGNGPSYCGYGQQCGDEEVGGAMVPRSPKQCLIQEGYATWRFTHVRQNLYTVESGAAGSGWECLVFGRRGNELYPSRATCEGWDPLQNNGIDCPYQTGMSYCGFQASGSGSADEALLADRSAVWKVIVLKQQANKFILSSNAANPPEGYQCLAFANNGLDRNPRRYDWGNGGVFCGAGNWGNNVDEMEGQKMGLLNNKQAVWVLTYLTNG